MKDARYAAHQPGPFVRILKGITLYLRPGATPFDLFHHSISRRRSFVERP
jgi:hypothetical protein